MITKEADYAIRAVLCLAQNSRVPVRLSAADLSRQMDIPYRFLRNITRLLVEAGIVEARRGNGGGLKLRQPPAKLSVYDVIQAVNPRSCILNDCLQAKGRCPRNTDCPVHAQLVKLQDLVDSRLKNLRFDQLANG